MRIIIDAGHGYDTPGKRSPILDIFGIAMNEWEFNSGVAHQLQKLCVDEGIKHKLTSTSIGDLSLTARAKAANDYIRLSKEKAYFVSIHANAFGDGVTFNDVHGVETLYNKDLPFALIMQKNLSTYNLKSRGVKQRGDLYLLKNVNCPSVLVECGFMTNLTDLANLMTYTYKVFCAKAILASVKEYHNGGLSV